MGAEATTGPTWTSVGDVLKGMTHSPSTTDSPPVASPADDPAPGGPAGAGSEAAILTPHIAAARAKLEAELAEGGGAGIDPADQPGGCTICGGTGLRWVKGFREREVLAADGTLNRDVLARRPRQVACRCVRGEAYRGQSSGQIALRQAVERLFQQPPWAHYATARVDDFCGSAGRNLVESAVAALRQSVGVYVWGGVGTGKTHLACALVHWYVAQQACHDEPGMVRLFYVADWLDRIKQAFDEERAAKESGMPGRLTPEQIVAWPEGPDFVVLDDLGVEHLTPWVASRLDVLLHKRWAASPRKLTVITCNLNLGQLGRRFAQQKDLAVSGARLCSRIGGMCRVLEVAGPDRRVSAREEPSR